MPVEQGAFDHIVNVEWEAGLAVEFFDKDGPPKPPDTDNPE
jgi:hypothetical protein